MITIDKKALKAMSFLAAKDDPRYYLNGIYVEYSAMETRLIATNGHVMGIHRSDAKGENDDTALGNLIIPDSAVKAMLAWKTDKNINAITLTPISETEYRADYCGDGIVFSPTDGKYPDYRRAVPEKASGKTAQFDAQSLNALRKTAETLLDDKHKKAYMRIGHNGNNGALVELCGIENFIGVIMPIRDDDADIPRSAPAWAKNPLEYNVILHCSPEIAEMIDANGGLQKAGLLKVAA